MSAPGDWDHVVKLDPDKELPPGETFEDICTTATDAVMVGGTTGMTEGKMVRVVEACARYDVPVYIEPSHPSAVIHSAGLDGYLVPTVLNAGDVAWVVGAHKEWAKHDAKLDWNNTTTEAYIVLNPESSVAAYTQADCDLGREDIAAYVTVAERMFGQEIVYVEYSGTYGDPEMVAAASDACRDATVFYGGGVRDYETAYEMGQYADTVIVGDLVHDEGTAAVRETVRGARDASAAQQEGPNASGRRQ